MHDEGSSGLGQFQTTQWGLIEGAQQTSSTARLAALNELLRRYLPALRAHLVLARRLDTDRANDLLQGFVTEKILERDLIAQADPAKGRFRSLLLKSLENYVHDQVRHDRAQKRFAGPLVALDDDSTSPYAPAVTDDSRVYDAMWARRTLFEVFWHMHEQCQKRGTPHTWQVFEHRIVRPLLLGAEPLDYDELVRRVGLRSPKHATNALATAKRQFEESLRHVIGQYAEGEEELEAEIRQLHAALAGAGTLGVRWPADESLAPSLAPGTDRGTPVAESFAAFDFDDVNPEVLAHILNPRSDPNAHWSEDDMAAIWRHQLALPLATLFDQRDWAATLGKFAGSTAAESDQTLEGFLRHPQPPLEVLYAVKRLAKTGCRAGTPKQLANIATALYFASIVAALAHHNERITRGDDDVLRYGLRLLLARPWLDDATRATFQAALKSLD